jgi:hypothetical protein
MSTHAGMMAALVIALGVAPVSALAAPQYGADAYYPDGPTVRCDSNDNRYVRCPADTRGGAQIVRQYSKSQCIEGRTWGVDRDAVWVSSGCRAEFALGRGGGNGGGWGNNGGAGYGDTVRCDSNDNRYHQCPIDARRVVLVRQYSKSQCIEGQTWGYERGYVWVSNGCRAEFAGRSGRGWNGGGWNGGSPEDGNGGGWNGQGWGQAQTLYCGSDDRRQRRCNVTIRRDARMTRQMSKSPCLEGQSWGWDRDGIWVSNGCRAEFAVR